MFLNLHARYSAFKKLQFHQFQVFFSKRWKTASNLQETYSYDQTFGFNRLFVPVLLYSSMLYPEKTPQNVGETN